MLDSNPRRSELYAALPTRSDGVRVPASVERSGTRLMLVANRRSHDDRPDAQRGTPTASIDGQRHALGIKATLPDLHGLEGVSASDDQGGRQR